MRCSTVADVLRGQPGTTRCSTLSAAQNQHSKKCKKNAAVLSASLQSLLPLTWTDSVTRTDSAPPGPAAHCAAPISNAVENGTMCESQKGLSHTPCVSTSSSAKSAFVSLNSFSSLNSVNALNSLPSLSSLNSLESLGVPLPSWLPGRAARRAPLTAETLALDSLWVAILLMCAYVTARAFSAVILTAEEGVRGCARALVNCCAVDGVEESEPEEVEGVAQDEFRERYSGSRSSCSSSSQTHTLEGPNGEPVMVRHNSDRVVKYQEWTCAPAPKWTDAELAAEPAADPSTELAAELVAWEEGEDIESGEDGIEETEIRGGREGDSGGDKEGEREWEGEREEDSEIWDLSGATESLSLCMSEAFGTDPKEAVALLESAEKLAREGRAADFPTY